MKPTREALRRWLPDLPAELSENALITVTELVSNAVRFGLPPIHLRVSVAADVLVVRSATTGRAVRAAACPLRTAASA